MLRTILVQSFGRRTFLGHDALIVWLVAVWGRSYDRSYGRTLDAEAVILRAFDAFVTVKCPSTLPLHRKIFKT